MFFLSVIIPCFNSAKLFLDYYRSTLSAVNDVEFVIVDDCSTDNSFELLKSTIKEDNFVIIRNEKNAGPGPSRNAGIQRASGEYVTFLDADDRFDPIFFDCIRKTTLSKPDLILFDHVIEFGRKTKEDSVFFKKPNGGSVTNEFAIVFTRGSPWGKVYKRSILIESGVQFLSQMRNEDTPFSKVAISFCRKIEYINYPLYVYVDNALSITHTNRDIAIDSAANAYEYIKTHINPEFNYCLDAIFAKELLYSASTSQIRRFNHAEWKIFVDNIISGNQKFFKSPLCSKLPIKYRLFCYLIRKRKYFVIKMLLNILGR